MNIKKHLAILITISMLLISPNTYAVKKEYILKAGFLFNFARYGQWETHNKNSAHFNICSPDQHFSNTATKLLKNKTVNSKKLHIKHITLSNKNITPCHILFITDDALPQWHSFSPDPLLNTMIVGENKHFIENGGHIRFFISGGKIRFAISPTSLKKSGVTISSKVLRLARVVGN